MINYQLVKKHIIVLKGLQHKSPTYMSEHVGDLEQCMQSCDIIKKHLREAGHSNVAIRKFLSKSLSFTVGGKRIPCGVAIDLHSRTSKYYPIYLLAADPAGTLTTLYRLLTDDRYLFMNNGQFMYNESFQNIHSETYNLVMSNTTRIEQLNGGKRFIGEGEKKKEIDYGFTLSEFTIKPIDNTMYFGVELEVGRKSNTPRAICKMVMKDLNPEWEYNEENPGSPKGIGFGFIKRDGSIDGGSAGFEIVSAPATLLAHKKHWETFFNNSAKYLRSYTLNNCGMHVHVSRAGFKNEIHQGKFLAFYNNVNNKPFLELIAGRKENRDYARYTEGKKANCILKKDNDDGNRYRAVNVQNLKTLEVRIFKGNTKKEGFFKNLEFVAATIEFTSICSLNNIVVKDNSNNTIGGRNLICYKGFLEWLKQPNIAAQYPYLTRWLVAREIVEIKTVKLQDDINPKNTGKQHLKLDYIKDVA